MKKYILPLILITFLLSGCLLEVSKLSFTDKQNGLLTNGYYCEGAPDFKTTTCKFNGYLGNFGYDHSKLMFSDGSLSGRVMYKFSPLDSRFGTMGYSYMSASNGGSDSPIFEAGRSDQNLVFDFPSMLNYFISLSTIASPEALNDTEESLGGIVNFMVGSPEGIKSYSDYEKNLSDSLGSFAIPVAYMTNVTGVFEEIKSEIFTRIFKDGSGKIVNHFMDIHYVDNGTFYGKEIYISFDPNNVPKLIFEGSVDENGNNNFLSTGLEELYKKCIDDKSCSVSEITSLTGSFMDISDVDYPKFVEIPGQLNSYHVDKFELESKGFGEYGVTASFRGSKINLNLLGLNFRNLDDPTSLENFLSKSGTFSIPVSAGVEDNADGVPTKMVDSGNESSFDVIVQLDGDNESLNIKLARIGYEATPIYSSALGFQNIDSNYKFNKSVFDLHEKLIEVSEKYREANTLIKTHFIDTNETPYAKEIQDLYQRGIVAGYGFNVFKPDNVLNRAEILKILLESKPGNQIERGTACFNDINGNEWFAGYICFGKNRGIVSGYSNGSFGPGNTVNRVEAYKMISNILLKDEVNNDFSGFNNVYDNVKQGDWYFEYVAKVYDYLPSKVKNSFTLEVGEGMSRGEFSYMVSKILNR